MGDFARMVFDLLVISSVWMSAPTLEVLAFAVVAAVIVAAVAIAVLIPAEPVRLFVAPRMVALIGQTRRLGRAIRSPRRARAPSAGSRPSHA